MAGLWIIWLLGFLLGFSLHRTILIPQLELYAPWLTQYYSAHPFMRPGHLAVFLFFTPLWAAGVFTVSHIALLRQRSLETSLRALERHRHKEIQSVKSLKEDQTADSLSPGEEKENPQWPASLTGNGFPADIAQNLITHIVGEDHYARVFFMDGTVPGHVLIKVPLKELSRDLSFYRFVQVHRSYLVNLNHISHLEKAGRTYRAVLSGQNRTIPSADTGCPNCNLS